MDHARLYAEQQAAEGGVVVTVTGEVDVSTIDVLADALSRAAEVTVLVVVDLSAVTFLDSTGISTLLHAHHTLVDKAGQLTLAGAQPPVLRILELTGVDTVIPLYPTVAQVLRSTDHPA